MKLELPDAFFSEEELLNTPRRWQGLFEEWAKKQDFKFTTFPNPAYNQLIACTNIDFSSLCSHHLLPFHGQAHIGYLPSQRICGISKLPRVVDKFASKPQIQERMTEEIADFIMQELSPQGVIVVVEAVHECMRMRGVKKANSIMKTNAVRGIFLEKPHIKEEFMSLIRKG